MWSHLHSRLFLHRWKSLDSIREVIQRSHSTCQISNMHDEGPRPVNATCGDVVFWPADGSVFLIIIRPLVHQAVFVWAQTLHTQTNTPVSCNRAAPPGCLWLGDPFVMGERVMKPESVGHLASSPPPLTSLCLPQSEASSPLDLPRRSIEGESSLLPLDWWDFPLMLHIRCSFICWPVLFALHRQVCFTLLNSLLSGCLDCLISCSYCRKCTVSSNSDVRIWEWLNVHVDVSAYLLLWYHRVS